MAEFCLDCLNKISELNLKRYHVKLFRDLDLCEECGQYKRCVARINTLGMIAEEMQYRKQDKNRKK